MKRPISLLLLLASVLAGGLHCLDLAAGIDPVTGFVLSGSVWLRYGMTAALLLAFALAARLLPIAPRPLPGRDPVLSLASLAAAVGFTALGVLGLVWTGYLMPAQKTMYLLSFITGLWLLLVSVTRMDRSPGPLPGSALWGIAASLNLYLLILTRISGRYSGPVRLLPTLRVFSALAALLLFSALVRALYLPETVTGQMLAFSGFAAFYLCTCTELPQTLLLVRRGQMGADALALSAALGLVGLVGAVCAVRTLSRPDGAEPTEP